MGCWVSPFFQLPITHLCCLSTAPLPVVMNNGLTFLSLGSSAMTFTGVDDDSVGPISFPTPLQFGSTMQSEAYVRSNTISGLAVYHVCPFCCR